VTAAVGRFPTPPDDRPCDPKDWPAADKDRVWALIAKHTCSTREECRDLAAALGLVDQPVWVTRDPGKGGRDARRRVR
jgi:hypothetical protein